MLLIYFFMKFVYFQATTCYFLTSLEVCHYIYIIKESSIICTKIVVIFNRKYFRNNLS